MLIKSVPTSPGTRHRVRLDHSHLSNKRPESALISIRKPQSGRNHSGKVTMRHQGGGEKRFYRILDFKRNKREIVAQVAALEYDPNRSANIALLFYADGEKRYILAPVGLEVGHTVIASAKADLKPGNALPLSAVPIGTIIHNIELRPGKGGQLARSAGVSAILQAKETLATLKMPSGEIRLVPLECYATIGAVGNADHKNIKYGKAGRKRHLGIRPSVRGVAMNPNSHPHGGGEGRSGIGRPSPLSPWGKKTLGKKTRTVKKYSRKFILNDRRK